MGIGFREETFINVQNASAKLKKMEGVLICSAPTATITGAGYVAITWKRAMDFGQLFILHAR
jgi:hypothetical protein